MRIELLLDYGCGEDVDFPASVAMPGDVGLRSAIAGLDLETSMVECVHLCARTQTRARRSS